jgi:hypothetical protein
MAKKKDHHRFDRVTRLLERNIPLILLLIWALARPEQSADLVKLVAAFMAGKGIKIIG